HRHALGRAARRNPLHVGEPAPRRPLGLARRLETALAPLDAPAAAAVRARRPLHPRGLLRARRARAVQGRAGLWKIAWASRGSRARVLLVQGLGYARWGWDPVVPGLAERFRVLTFDTRGIGESDKPAGPYTAREMAADAVQVLDEAGLD